MRGFAKPGHGAIPSTGGDNYTDDMPTYPYDVEKAKALLDEAGVRLRRLHRPAPWGEYTQLWGESFVQAMREIGIEMELLANDAPGFLNGVYRNHDFGTANGRRLFRSDPAVSTVVWLRSDATAGTPWSNQFGWHSDEMDQLIDAAAQELDPKERAAMYHELQKMAMEELPVTFAIEHPFISVTPKRLRNHRNTPRWVSSS